MTACPKPRPHLLDKRERAQDCSICGKRFSSQRNNQRVVCSVSCLRTYQANKRRDRLASFECRICGGPARNRRATTGRCCSLACGQKLRTQRARTRRPGKCKACSKDFTARHQSGRWEQFCSYRCAIEYRRRTPRVVELSCAQCNATVRRCFGAAKRVRRVFCSNQCARAYFRGQNSPAYRGGSDPNRGTEWLRLAERIRERDGHRCQRCERTQEENGQRLSVDHILPWRSFENKEEANAPENLTSLCRKCHAWKTQNAERKLLKGDVIEFQQYRRSVTLPPLFAPVGVGREDAATVRFERAR